MCGLLLCTFMHASVLLLVAVALYVRVFMLTHCLGTLLRVVGVMMQKTTRSSSPRATVPDTVDGILLPAAKAIECVPVAVP